MNLQSFTFPRGIPEEDCTRTRSSDASPAWRASPHQHHTSDNPKPDEVQSAFDLIRVPPVPRVWGPG